MTVFNNFICGYRHNKRKKILQTIIAITFSDVLIIYKMFLSPKAKGIIISNDMIISNKYGIYELPHKLPDNLGLRILGN